MVRYAARGIEYMAPFEGPVAQASSTYRELFGVAGFISAVAPLLRGGGLSVVFSTTSGSWAALSPSLWLVANDGAST